MKHKNRLYQLGKHIHNTRWLIVACWLIILTACIPFLPSIIKPFKSTGFIDEHSRSAKAADYLTKKLGFNADNKMLIIYHSDKLTTDNPRYLQRVKKSLSALKHFPLKHTIFYLNDKEQVSKDKHTAYVMVVIKSKEPLRDALLEKFKSAIKKPSGMRMQLGGEPVFVDNLNKQLQEDMIKADMIAAPVALITLILTFGSLTAAMLPILLGGSAVLIILTILYFLGQVYELSIFTLNIAILLGLCLTLDYSLFIISRFREELHQHAGALHAVAKTVATAGKAVFFSGLAIFISLGALFLFPVNILFSVAMGGLTAIFTAVCVAIVLLPAILSIIKTKIDFLSIHFLKPTKRLRWNFWQAIGTKIVNYPLSFFIPTLIFLLLLGLPFLSAKFGISDYRMFPKSSENRQFYDSYASQFKLEELTPITMVVETNSASILSERNIGKLMDLTKEIKENPLVSKVNSIVTTPKKLSKYQYYQMYKYSLKNKWKKDEVRKLLDLTTAKSLTTLNIVSKHPLNTRQMDTLIEEMEEIRPGAFRVQLTGTPVLDKEVLETISRTLPWVILWIVIFTYLILILLLRSLFLPFKAIVMNFISLCACYGILVLVIQDGYLSRFLNFEPQGMLDISLLVIIFCTIFGFSMDYEVFLLTRIKESWDLTHDNKASIILGLEKSSRIIVSAALIVLVICASFLVADVLLIKAFGLGIGIAIFVDAFLIRTLLVPSTMALLQKWNWYLPKFMRR